MINDNVIPIPTETPEKRAENKTERKPSLSRAEMHVKKLQTLTEKREKAYTAQSTAEKRAKEIEEQILKVKEEIHNDSLKEFDSFCRKNDISLNDVSAFISALTEKLTLSEAAELIGIKFTKGGNRNE